MSNQSFVNKLLQSFGHALEGFPLAFSDRNMKIHGLAAGVVIFAGWWFQIMVNQNGWWFLLIGAIWALEMVNSAIEELSNTVRDSLQAGQTGYKNLVILQQVGIIDGNNFSNLRGNYILASHGATSTVWTASLLIWRAGGENHQLKKNQLLLQLCSREGCWWQRNPLASDRANCEVGW